MRGRRPNKAPLLRGCRKLYYHVKEHGVLEWAVVELQDEVVKQHHAQRILKRAKALGIVKGQLLPRDFDLGHAIRVVARSLIGNSNSQSEFPITGPTVRNPSRDWELGAKHGVGGSDSALSGKSQKPKLERARGIAKGGSRSKRKRQQWEARLYSREFEAAYQAIVVPALKTLGYPDEPLPPEADRPLRRVVWKNLHNGQPIERFAKIVLHMKWRREQDPSFRNWNDLKWIWRPDLFTKHYADACASQPSRSYSSFTAEQEAAWQEQFRNVDRNRDA